jgi:kynurenine formamidase
MKTTITFGEKTFEIDLSKPLDISIPMSNTNKNPIAWYLEQPVIEPVVIGDWVGKVSEGKSSTNFNNIFFNPHAHGTHTECLGHITHHFFSVNQALKTFFFKAKLISILPEKVGDDFVIQKHQLEGMFSKNEIQALIIRTLPNNLEKKSRNYSNTNPPFFSEQAAVFLKEMGVNHLLVDLPSVDKEHDEGKLLAHKAFWNVLDVKNINLNARFDATITEMVFVDNEITDGDYVLNLQIAPFENDASPSKPVLYLIDNIL